MDITLPEVVGGVGLLALMAYALFGGADFGGGMWSLIARGPRADDQRAAIALAMGPVWEANHVWLIFLIVTLFTAFPKAFAGVCVAYFVPFHLVLVGVVLRGAAFIFRAHGQTVHGFSPFWGNVFGAASFFTPAVLGACLGAASTGHIRFSQGDLQPSVVIPWLEPLALTVGALALATCAYLAAVYLTLETAGDLREDFRRRALWAAAAMWLVGIPTLLAARATAPWFTEAISHGFAVLVMAGGTVAAVAAAWGLLTRRFPLARTAAAGQVCMMLLGWALAQRPYIIYPDMTFAATAAPPATLYFYLGTLIPGGLVLIPSLVYLYKTFKGQNSQATATGEETTRGGGEDAD